MRVRQFDALQGICHDGIMEGLANGGRDETHSNGADTMTTRKDTIDTIDRQLFRVNAALCEIDAQSERYDRLTDSELATLQTAIAALGDLAAKIETYGGLILFSRHSVDFYA